MGGDCKPSGAEGMLFRIPHSFYVNIILFQYCLIEFANGVRTFKIPSLEDILKHRIVVVTLSISMYLSTMGLKKGL